LPAAKEVFARALFIFLVVLKVQHEGLRCCSAWRLLAYVPKYASRLARRSRLASGGF